MPKLSLGSSDPTTQPFTFLLVHSPANMKGQHAVLISSPNLCRKFALGRAGRREGEWVKGEGGEKPNACVSQVGVEREFSEVPVTLFALRLATTALEFEEYVAGVRVREVNDRLCFLF